MYKVITCKSMTIMSKVEMEEIEIYYCKVLIYMQGGIILLEGRM